MQLASIDGSLGRDGYTYNGQIGIVKALSERFDGGLFVSVFSSDINTSGLASSLDARGFGGGGYLKFSINDRLKAGIAANFERTDNDISISGATGSFYRDRFSLDASISSVHVFNGVNIVPSANLSWVHSNRQSYTDSTATLVPGTTDNTVAAIAAVSISKTYVSDNLSLLTVTPMLNMAANVYLEQYDDTVFADGSQIGYSTVSGTVNAGVGMRFVNGANLDVSGIINGIGADTQAYGGSIQYSVPLP